jgi:DNA-directed RNA polymerase specialized sigma24 family protein
MGSTSDVLMRPSEARFVTTHWSVIVTARGPHSCDSTQALDLLCKTYWFPLYAYVRWQGHSPPDAQDLTQEFFSRLLRRDWLGSVAQAKGKFRTFLLVLLRRFLADELDKARALKRGGGQVFSVDWSAAESRFLQHPVEDLTPERVFEQRWALALLDHVYNRLEHAYQAQGRGALFCALRFALAGSRSTVPYAALATQLSMTEGAVKVAVHRLRQSYRNMLREAIAETVSRPEEIEEGFLAIEL